MRPDIIFAKIFCLGVGSWSLILSISLLRKAQRTWAWRKVPGEVIRSSAWLDPGDISPGSSRRTGATHKVSVEYVYLVDGEYYRSSKIRLIDGGGSAFSMQGLVDSLPEGKIITVYSNPDNPGESILKPGPGATEVFFLLFGVVFLVIGIMIPIVQR